MRLSVAVIPARGGSKRIPRKNIRDFAGKPVIAWSIAAARDSGLFDHVIVSTDDPEIAQAALAAGAEVPFLRPDHLSGDHTGTVEVIAHAARWAIAAGWPVHTICCIYAAAPFVSPDDLREARAKLDEGWDFVFPAVRYGHPIQRAFGQGEDGGMVPRSLEHRQTRTQDLAPAYHDAGQFYWGTREAWLSGGPIHGERSAFIELPSWRAVDIDTPDDWTRAEYLLEIMERKNDVHAAGGVLGGRVRDRLYRAQQG